MSGSSPSSTPAKILVADDDASIRHVLAMMLSKAGYQPIAAASGTQALELASEQPPDMFILDVKMPEPDGYETCRQLKADPRFADIPVIFLSGHTRTDDRVQGLDVGAIDYVAKPFNAHELMARVRAGLRNSRHRKLSQLAALEAELDLAGRIQQSLLPRETPEAKGIGIFGAMLPMRKVGGDYYDFVEGPDSQIVCIGDVSGKGIPAALVMVMARTFLNHFDVNINDTRMTLLALNRLLYDNTDAGIFMSMVLFKWDVPSQTMSYTGAGHEHLLIYRARAKAVQVLRTGGQVLGLRPNILRSLEERELELGPADALLLYTDGVTEAMNSRHDEYGLERLRETFLGCAETNAKNIVETIFADVDAFAEGYTQTDDITVVVVRRNSLAGDTVALDVSMIKQQQQGG